MAFALDTTSSGETSNSYCDTTYADDYFADHYDAGKVAKWATLTSDNQKSRLLARACQIIESIRFTVPVTLPEYAIHYDRHSGKVLDLNLTRQPVKWYYYQNLQFPRNLDVLYQPPTAAQLTNDPNTTVGTPYIREEIKEAQCEQAAFLINFDDSAMANRLQGVTLDKLSLGKGAIQTTQEYAVTGTMLAPLVLEMLRPFMVKGTKIQRA